MIKGSQRLLQTTPDTRAAFLLPHYSLHPIFLKPHTRSQLLLKAAVTLGFLGMFRFSTYKKLGINNLRIVGQNGTEHCITSGSLTELSHHFCQKRAHGFYFTFSSKYHPIAFAFFSKLSAISNFWSRFCPVKILFLLARNRLLTDNIFPKSIVKAETLRNFLRFIARQSTPLGRHKFTPHSLRIGGHTFYSLKNMDSDFVHFLARRAICKASQLYYRANAYDNIIRLDMFFRSIRSHHILQN